MAEPLGVSDGLGVRVNVGVLVTAKGHRASLSTNGRKMVAGSWTQTPSSVAANRRQGCVGAIYSRKTRIPGPGPFP